jgi:formyltetrahydrofolate synthetase
MEQREEELIRQHLTHDDELRALYEEHLKLKNQLETFRNKLYLTSEEELEKKRIQKLKLASKDRLMEILHRHQHEAR